MTRFQVVTQYIDDVESLGDLNALNVEAIAKAMARNRSLYVYSLLLVVFKLNPHSTPENAKLFYNATNSKLVFYDATSTSQLPCIRSLLIFCFLRPFFSSFGKSSLPQP